MWNLLLCLLPTGLLLLTAALLHWSLVRTLLGCVMTRATWLLWKGVYWILELPPPTTHSEWMNATLHDQAATVGPPLLRLVCKPTALAQHLRLHCPTLRHPSLATAWPWGNPHLQTLSSLLCGPAEEDRSGDGRGKVHFTRDHLLLSDGGLVALDWATTWLKDEPLVVGGKSEQHHQQYLPHGACRSPGCRTTNGHHHSTLPILLVIPNCLGVVTAHLRRLCALALRWGFWPVVFHRRGQGGCPLTTPRYQEFGDPRDLAQAVAYVHRRHPAAMLAAVSEGSGSGLLLSYLGEYGSSSYLTAAACISPVLHSQLWFETPLPSLYHWGALYYRKLQISRYASALSGVMDVDRLLRCRTLRDLEELMFCAGGTTTSVTKLPPPPTTQATGDREVTHVSPDIAHHHPEVFQSHPDVIHNRLPLGGETQPDAGQNQRPASAQDWEAYWERNEPLRDADEVAVPVLCLCSSDDPLVPPPAAPLLTSLFRDSPYFLLGLTTHGGHCGFAQAAGKGGGGGGGGSGGSNGSNNRSINTGTDTSRGSVDSTNRSTSASTSPGTATSSSSWGHQVVLEYVQVVGDFLRGEERDRSRGRARGWGGGQDTAGGAGGGGGGGGGGVGGGPGPQQGARQRSGTLLARRRRAMQAVHRKRHQSYQHTQDELAEEELFTWNRSYTR